MKYIVRHQFRESTLGSGQLYYVTTFLGKLYHALKNKYPQHEFVIDTDKSYANAGDLGVTGFMHLSIINPENRNYILVSLLDDWKFHFYKDLGWVPDKMKKFYYCGSFNFVDYFSFKLANRDNKNISHPTDMPSVYRPFFYSTYLDSHYDHLDRIYNLRKNNKNLIKNVYFRGHMWDWRKHMTSKLDSKEFLTINKHENDQVLGYVEFLEDMAKYSCALSLPGGTNICNRDIECFATGVPVIRPALDNILEDPLHPDFHYLCFYHAPKYWNGKCSYLNYNDFQEHLTYYWNKIKDNTELLDFVSENAYKWFKKNCGGDKNVEYILSSLNLNDIA